MNGGRRTVILKLVLGCALAALATGCKSRPTSPADDGPLHPPIATQAQLLKRPAIDLSRGGAGFPMKTASPPMTPDAVISALKAGYAERLTDRDHLKVLAIGPAHGLNFDELKIDISDSAVKADFVPKDQVEKTESVGVVHAGLLTYLADPLHYQGADASLRLMAEQADLAVLPATDGTYGLSLTDCSRGRALLRLSLTGLRQSMAGAIKVHRSLAFEIDSVELNLASDSTRSLKADVVVHAKLLMIPATFRLTGRTDIDDAFNVHFSQLNAAGQDPAGALISAFLQTKLDKLNGRAAPLLKLPGDHIRVNALAIHVNEEITVDVGLRGTKK